MWRERIIRIVASHTHAFASNVMQGFRHYKLALEDQHCWSIRKENTTLHGTIERSRCVFPDRTTPVCEPVDNTIPQAPVELGSNFSHINIVRANADSAESTLVR